MAFPQIPETDDERRTEFLRLMGVEDFPGIYVLGCFARYVTVYAQQVRALNLIDTLAKGGVFSRHSSLAVIGAGIAGLTAAGAAAVRGVGLVSVFERLENTMRLQRATEKRYIHPHIYDWPNMESESGEAGLPLMDWEAGRAQEVVARLGKKWDKLRAEFGDCIEEPYFECAPLELTIGDGKPRITLKGQSKQYDVVILAVGFGRDAQKDSEGEIVTDSYWTDSNLDGLEAESNKTWLVSGAGDGALTDLMRLCIRDFQHRDVLNAVDQATKEKVGQRLLKVESPEYETEARKEEYLRAVAQIGDDLDNNLSRRNVGKVLLNCSPKEFFGQRSSVLNRLIATYLYERKRFELKPGKIASPIKRGDRYEITFEDGTSSLEVDKVILRHGPDRALQQSFPDIWRACRHLKEEWEEARQYEDWTRKPLYQPGDFDWEGKRCPPLRVSYSNQVGCVVMTGSRKPSGRNQPQRVAQALETFADKSGTTRFAGRRVAVEPEWITAAEALSSSASYERAVRALCDSEIAVFDISGLESVMMFFLGIRAAVRRGVTVTLTQDDLQQAPLPFNISSINPIQLGKGDTELIAKAFEAGFDALRVQPEGYLDLPAFDVVRRLSEEHRPLPPNEGVLVLRWFDDQYTEMIDDVIKHPLRKRIGENAKIVTSLDSSSPQLVGQRLYAAIRRANLCLADWTGWRPNVFFEIGVRLAVNKTDPVFILCENRPPGWKDGVDTKSKWPEAADPSAGLLENFFKPTRFDFTNLASLDQRIENFFDARKNCVQGARLSQGRTYHVVSRAIERRQEPGGRPLDEFLRAEAEIIAGPAVVEEGDPVPVLFGDVIGKQFQQAAIEYLLAAWYYLNGRHKLLPPWRAECSLANASQLLAIKRIGEELCARLLLVEGDEYRRLADEVGEALETINAVLKDRG